MRLFKKKNELPLSEEYSLTKNEGYSIDITTVISRPDCMIFRCEARLPYFDEREINVIAKNSNGEHLSLKTIFMGKGEVTEKVGKVFVYKSFCYSIFVPYPEQNFILSIIDKKDSFIIHEQLLCCERIKDLRCQQDDMFYKFADNDPYYNEWFKKQKPSATELDLQREIKLERQPKFSIVVPLYKTPINFFIELVGSVKAQTYSNWELILVNSSPEDKDLRVAVNEAVVSDSRILEIELKKNEGITLNTAKGIDSATGDFVCFVDHDDTIEPNTLFEYAKAIADDPDTQLLYCDEDKLFRNGKFGEVNFKPDFSLHLLRSNNYVCHMLCIKRELLLKLDYKDSSYDGAQDHHLTLQATEKTDEIAHIQRVLYHWRVCENSTAGETSAKPYAQNCTVKAVSEHLKRLGVSAEVALHPSVAQTTQVKYDIPDDRPKVSIIIPTKDHADILKRCLNSILNKSTYDNYEIIVVENNSDNETTFEYYETLKQNNKIKIVSYEGDFNFSKIINFGRSKSSGDYLLLLNNDTEVITENWIEGMLGVCLQPEVGIVGCKLLFPDDTIQHAGIYVGDVPHHYFHHLPNGAINYKNLASIIHEVSAVTAACMMVDAQTFDSVGGFNEDLSVSYNDVDFCFKVRKHEKLVIYNPFVELYHHESASRGYDKASQKQMRLIKEKGKMLETWPELFAYPDPYHTPNLSQNWKSAYFSF